MARYLKAQRATHPEGDTSVIKKENYGAFTVSRSKVDAVLASIDGQLIHHRASTFQEEYLKMLDATIGTSCLRAIDVLIDRKKQKTIGIAISKFFGVTTPIVFR